ncbi:MAG: hypothetical protein ACOYOS_11845 [Syntrophales bacterium]
MNTLFCLILTLIVGIGLGSAGADERGGLAFAQGLPAASLNAGLLDIPHWVVHIPEHTFVGISQPCPSIEEARQQALDSAIGQILQAMGAEYHLSHESTLTGDLNQSRHELKEKLSYTARWFLNSVQQNIKQYAFQDMGDGQVCFVLVRMTPGDLERLKRLSIGAKVSARLIGISGGQASIEVMETNGVGVTITEYQMTAAIRNSHARLITLFLWKVPETASTSYGGALPNRLSLNNSSGSITIPLSAVRGSLKSTLMGSKEDISITLTGYDEIGRQVSVPVRFQ